MADTPPVSTSAEPTGWRRSRLLRRWLPMLVIVGIGIWMLRAQPSDVALVYELGERGDGLAALRVDLYRVPEHKLARHAEFLYSARRPAPLDQVHWVRLTRGTYSVEATLEYADGRIDKVTRTIEFAGDERIAIRL